LKQQTTKLLKETA